MIVERGGRKGQKGKGDWQRKKFLGGCVNMLGILSGKSAASAAIHRNPLFLTWSAGLYPPAGAPNGVGMHCSHPGIGRNGMKSLGTHISTPSRYLCIQSTRGSVWSLHGLSRQRKKLTFGRYSSWGHLSQPMERSWYC